MRVAETGLRTAVGLGVETYRSDGRRQRARDGSTVAPFTFDDPSLDAAYAFAEASYKLSPEWLVEGGLRLLAARTTTPPGRRTEYMAGVPDGGNVIGVDSAAGRLSVHAHPSTPAPRPN